jgi:hypothetical protein
MLNETERRTLLEPIEFRSEGDKLTAEGYAIVYNKLSSNLGGFVERAAPGLANKTIKEQDVVALANHDPNLLLGRMSSGTLRVEPDDNGVRYSIDLPDTSTGRDWANLIARGDIVGSSFGFKTLEDEWGETEQGFPLRTLKAILLRDLGPVTFPAYADTSAAMRSLSALANVELEQVRQAADANELRPLVSLALGEPPTDDRSPTIIRQHITHLYA